LALLIGRRTRAWSGGWRKHAARRIRALPSYCSTGGSPKVGTRVRILSAPR